MAKTQITVTIEQDGDVKTEISSGADETYPPEEGIKKCIPLYPEEDERHAVVSHLANVCEYLKESEVITIQTIIGKAWARREREEQ